MVAVKLVSLPVKGKNATQSQKLQNLSSNIHGLQGVTANKFYQMPQSKGQVVDFMLSGMKSNMNEAGLKKISGAKHVISSTIEIDNLKGTCSGQGRI